MSKKTPFGMLLEEVLERTFGDWRKRTDWLPDGFSFDTVENWIVEGTLPQTHNFLSLLSELNTTDLYKEALKNAYFDLKVARRKKRSEKSADEQVTIDPIPPQPANTPLIGISSVVAQIDVNRLVGVGEMGQAVVDSLLKDNARFISIEGQGGIGKTAIALWVVDRIRQEQRFEGIVWITVGDYFSLSLGEIATIESEPLLDQIARLLSLTHSQMVTNVLQNSAYLIVIDNIETDTDAQSILPLLQALALGKSRVLLTSRYSISQDYAHVLSLEVQPLSRASVGDLLHWFSKVKLSPKKMDEVYEVVGGIPLALHLLARLVKSGNLTSLLNGIKNAKHDESDQGAKIAAMFEFIYGRIWQRLAEDTRQFIVLFARQSPPGGHLLRDYALISCCVQDDCTSVLEQALSYYLVTSYGEDDNQYLVIHELTRAYIRLATSKA